MRTRWALVITAGAMGYVCVLLAACDWFAGTLAGGSDSDGGSTSSSTASDAQIGGFDSGLSVDAEIVVDAGAGGETGRDAAVEAQAEASDDASAAGDACASCVNGCFAGACTSPLTSLGGTAASSAAGTTTIVQTAPDSPSTGGGPVSSSDSVTVTTTTKPGGENLTVSVDWGTTPGLPTGTFTTINMTRTTSTQTADTWTGVIPAQAAGEVYFFVVAAPAIGNTLYDPSTFQVVYAYAVN